MKVLRQGVFALPLLLAMTVVFAGGMNDAGIQKVDVDGIVNFSRFDGPPGFIGTPAGFGGVTQASAMPWLQEEGFKTVIDLRLAVEDGVAIDAEGERAAAEAAGLQYIHLAFDPKGSDLHVVEEFLSVAGNKLNQPVYIHCNSATRAAALWVVARRLRDGLDADQAAQEGKAIAEKPEEAIAFATAYVESRGR